MKNSTVEPGLTATSVIRSPCYYGHFFLALRKTPTHFLVKKPTLIWSPVNMAKLFWLIGDRINGAPLY